MIGDPKQLQAIGPAGWLNQELAKREHIELEQVYRQTDLADREAFDLIREGQAYLALNDLAERGRVHAVEQDAELVSKVLERVKLHRDSGRDAGDLAVVHQGSNLNLDTINRFVQRDRIHRGELGLMDLDGRRTWMKLEEASTGRRWTLFAGDLVVLNKGIRADLWEPIRNGSTGVVTRMTADGRCRIKLDGPERREVTVQLHAREEVQPIAPAYAMSSHKLQGGERDVVIVVPGTPETASLNSAYSQCTRAREHLDIVVSRETWSDDPVRALGRAWSRPDEKHLASELMAEVDLEDVDLEPVEQDQDLSLFDSGLDLTEPEEAQRLIDDLQRELRQRDRGDDFGLEL